MWLHKYCCCGGGCQFCSGVSPDEITATFSGVSQCGEPCYPGNSIGQTWVATPALNASHTLTRNTAFDDAPSSACVWEVTYANGIRQDYYEDVDCGGAIVLTEYLDVTIRLTFNGSTWILIIIDSLSGQKFSDTQSAPVTNDCADSLPSFTNDYASSDCGTFLPGGLIYKDGYDGTATIAAV